MLAPWLRRAESLRSPDGTSGRTAAATEDTVDASRRIVAAERPADDLDSAYDPLAMPPESAAPDDFERNDTHSDGAPLDVIVLGGGAAGIFAATSAAATGARTLLLERNRRPGIKVLASGGSRCNVTSVLPPHEMLRHYGRDGARFLGHAMKALPPDSIVALLDAEGVPTYEEKWQKIFPRSNRATDVLAAFLVRFERAGAQLRVNARAVAVTAREGGFAVHLEDGETLAGRSIVLAVGGRSYPKTGSTGDGYAIAAAFGHTIVTTRPALVPLLAADDWVRESTGIAFQDVAVTLRDPAGKALATRRRPLLFTHFGVSGPAAMDVSREATGRTERTRLEVDFAPDASFAAMERELEARIAAAPNRRLEELLPVEWPERFAARLLATRGVLAERRGAETGKDARRAAIELVKAAPITVTGSRGFDFAEVTAGGVALPEVDPATMASRLQRGFFVCGEVLDVDGPIGGFNFQAAFATGHVAGEAAARHARRSPR
jgi:predicted Rossmann fold flavoprotein